MSKLSKSIETEIRKLAARGWRKGVEWTVTANGYESSDWGDENVLELGR